MIKSKKMITMMIATIICVSNYHVITVNAQDSNVVGNLKQNDESIITTIELETVKNDIKNNNIFYKTEKIAPEKPYLVRINKSEISMGSYYHAQIKLYGYAREGSTVYIKLGSQVAEQKVDNTESFGFNIETRSRDITVELYTVNHKGEQSDSIFVNLTSEGDYIINNGTYPTPNTMPVINAKDINIALGSEFNPLKDVSAIDNEDGDITDNLIITENTVDTSKIGDYKVVYQVVDSDDNIAIKECKVRVDVNKNPVLNCNDIILKVGEKFNPLDYVTAVDNEDGDITNKIKIIENTVNIDKIGDYKVSYEVEDSNGAIARKTITVKVRIDVKFSDVLSTHWAYKEIMDFAQRGYVNGSDGKFRPNDSITRAEFVKIVNKTFGYNKVGTEKYSDVNPGSWYYNEVCIAVGAGYIDANQAKFRPNDPITREEAAAIITSIQKCKDTDLDKIKTYTDYNKVSSWALSSVEGAIEKGYMGVGSKEFRPKANITRAEAVVTLYRVNNIN